VSVDPGERELFAQFLGMPHCLKKKGTRCARQRRRMLTTQSRSMGRACGPLSPPTITQSIPRRSSGPRSANRGSTDRNRICAGVSCSDQDPSASTQNQPYHRVVRARCQTPCPGRPQPEALLRSRGRARLCALARGHPKAKSFRPGLGSPRGLFRREEQCRLPVLRQSPC